MSIASPFRILVVTPTLGTSRWLDQTVESVRRLSLPGLRHVLVAPAAVLAALTERYPAVQVVPEPGGGMYAAINAGLAAFDDWQAFTYINDDDLLLPAFAQVVRQAQAGGERIVYGGVRLIDTAGRRIGAIPISPWPSFNRLLYAQRMEPVYQHGTVVTRAVVDRLGGFDTTLHFCGDSEFLARSCVNQVPFVCATSRPVAAFRLRAGQATKNLPVMLNEHRILYAKHRLPAEKITWAHRRAWFAFRTANVSVYLERIARHGFIRFGEQLAKVE